MPTLGSDAINAIEMLGEPDPQHAITAEIVPKLVLPYHLRDTGVSMEIRSSAPGQDVHGVPTGDV